MNWAIEQQIVTHWSQRLVLICLARYADNEGIAHPSNSALCLDTGLSEATVRRALDKLQDVGVIYRGEMELRKVKPLYVGRCPAVYLLRVKP